MKTNSHKKVGQKGIAEELFIELILFSSVSMGFYVALVIFSAVQWNWLWFFVAIILSAISILLRQRRLSKFITEAYFLGIKYLKDRYELPSIFGSNWDERDNVESEEDRAMFDNFSSKMTKEQFKRIFPEEYQEQQDEIAEIKKMGK